MSTYTVINSHVEQFITHVDLFFLHVGAEIFHHLVKGYFVCL